MSETASYSQIEPAAPGAIERLKDTTMYLHDRLDLLAHRLENVLGSEYPEAVAEDAMSPATIDRLIQDVQRACGRIDNILSRLVL